MRRSLLALAASILLAGQTPALAHSTLERSEPSENAVLKTSPNELRMWFTAPVKVALCSVEVRGEDGAQVDLKDLHFAKGQPAETDLSLRPHLDRGSYKVTWVAVAEDMHVSRGSFTFRVAP